VVVNTSTVVETMASIGRRKLFGAGRRHVQPQKRFRKPNTAVYLARFEVGDTVNGLESLPGGHLNPRDEN